ncbi:hypothetical protein [Flavobacterium sp. 245]|uniref:hypothetical protein n=1 Tax=Flavobacterium sp. 245 TaxID=2512115 RepID=UPI00105CDA01|nr:hypothetical protein [Flavobacterium sp. 245]TDO94971.1 hypothetical protein EV145_11560 [Flavobacterium sp. 245]
MRKITILYFILISLASSCQDKKQTNKNNINDSQILSNTEKHTFYRVSQNGKERVIYQPCDANIEKYIVYHDSIFHDLGQEFYTFKVLSQKNENNKYKYSGEYIFGKTAISKESITFEAIDNNKKYWKINNELFIDSLYANTIIHKQQSCKECYEGCEGKEKETKVSSINGKWGTNCNNPIGITVKENELIICVEPNNYYIHLTKVNGKAGDKTLKYKLNRLDGFGSKDVYSESYLNDNEIAIIKILENDKIEFNWLGFYNKVNKQRQYTDPIISNDNPVLLEKCEN